jgi:hypothetical protein
MARIALKVATLVVAVMVCLTASAPAAATASAMEVCRLNMVGAGEVGEVGVPPIDLALPE